MNNDKYAGKKVFGAAIKYTGDILKPFLSEEEGLKNQIEAIKNEQDMTAWYPLSTVISLFEIAEKNGFLERLASSWAIQVVREMRKQGSVKTPTNALKMLEAGFPMQHQGNVGTFSVRVIDEKSVEISDHTYAQCGYLSTLCQSVVASFGAKDAKITHLSNTCKKSGGASCTYTLEWEESDLLKMWSENGT
jgi:hypothetical protein